MQKREATRAIISIFLFFFFILCSVSISAKANEPSGTLLDGRSFNETIKKFVNPNFTSEDLYEDGSEDCTIKEIIFLSSTDSIPTSYTDSANIGEDVTAYYDSNTQKVYLYTTASKFIFPTNSSSMFNSFTILQTISFGDKIDTTNVTDMDDFFHWCYALDNLDISSFDTSKVENMDGLFSMCSSLSQIDITNFKTSNVTDMWGLFFGCSNLNSLDLSHLNTSKVTRMGCMFLGCNKLSSLDVSSFDTSKVIYMCGMFDGCTSIHTLDLTNFDMSSVVYADDMFEIHEDGEIYLPKMFGVYKPFWDSGSIIDDCFSRLDKSVTVHYPGTIAEWDALGYTFANVICSDGAYEPIVDIANGVISDIPNQIYCGSMITPPISLTCNGKILISGTDYDVTYKNNINIGTATVTATGKGKYKGSVSKNFEIVKSSDINNSDDDNTDVIINKKQKTTTLSKPVAGKKSMTITWKKQTKGGIKGYEIQYATDKKFTKDVKTVRVNKAKTTNKTIKKLKSGKKYYVRIRTFTKKNGEKVYSKWSKTKSVKVK